MLINLLSILFFSSSLSATPIHPELPPELINAPYPVNRYFRNIPIEEAHSSRGLARFEYLDKNKVNVLVWNIQKLKQKSWAKEFNDFGQNKDLILFQEAYEDEQFITHTQNLNDFRWDFGKSFEYLLYGVLTGNMIGSNTQPDKVTVLHSPDFEPILDTPKTTVAAYYPITNSEEKLLVISIHGINFTTNSAFYRQLNQVFSLIDQHTGPVIFAGDFNTHNQKRFQFLKKEADKRKLTNLDFKNSHLRKKFLGNILDYTFARNAEVIESHIPPQSKGSDHSPMILTLKIKE